MEAQLLKMVEKLEAEKTDLYKEKTDLYKKLDADKSELWTKLLEERKMLSEETVKRSKLEHDLKATNAEWMKRRGRLEPRTAIDHCERCKFGPLGITVDSNNRSKHWEVLWEKPDFEEFKKLALEGSSIPSAYNKARKFGEIVQSIYRDQNQTAHVMSGNSVVVPRGFTPDQKIVLRAICSFIPVDCEEESSLL